MVAEVVVVVMVVVAAVMVLVVVAVVVTVVAVYPASLAMAGQEKTTPRGRNRCHP